MSLLQGKLFSIPEMVHKYLSINLNHFLHEGQTLPCTHSHEGQGIKKEGKRDLHTDTTSRLEMSYPDSSILQSKRITF